MASFASSATTCGARKHAWTKMDARITCEFLLQQIRSSNLNFILEETPFSAYLTIRKSFLKNINSSNLLTTFNNSEEMLKKKIADLEAENLYLKSDNFDLRTELKNSEHNIIKLEEKFKNAEIQIIKYNQESKKVQSK